MGILQMRVCVICPFFAGNHSFPEKVLGFPEKVLGFPGKVLDFPGKVLVFPLFPFDGSTSVQYNINSTLLCVHTGGINVNDQ